MIARYGQAIEYDLLNLPGGGLDLAAEWQKRRWRRLLNIIDRLPRTSAYIESLSEDDQMAEQMVQQPEPKATPRRRMSDWSATVELLSSIFNRLGELTQAVAALGGAKPRKIQPAPHPITAIERARNRKKQEKHRSLVARVLPKRSE